MKKVTVFFLILLIAFLYIDNKAYYYGQGFGVVASKLPPMYSILYARRYLDSSVFIVKEHDMGTHLVRPSDSIFVQLSLGKEDKVIVKKIVGYGFKYKSFFVQVRDINNKLVVAEVYGYDFVKRKNIPLDYKYIDLDKSEDYFKRFFLVRKIIMMLLILNFIYLLTTLRRCWVCREMKQQ